MTKLAVLSMDVEDWYHTGYLKQEECDRTQTQLDGLDIFVSVLHRQQVPAQLFVLADLLERHPERFQKLKQMPHELASHGRSHTPPSSVSVQEFAREIAWCCKVHRETLGVELKGFRACRFMIDRERVNILRDHGLDYDSSVIDRAQHNHFDRAGFQTVSPHVWRQESFFEFRPPSFQIAGLNWPIAGGGAMRILPWWMTALPLQQKLRSLELYSFYLHPIDIARSAAPPLPASVGLTSRLRMRLGRASMADKLERLILMLKENGFGFTTYGQLRQQLLHDSTLLSSAG